MPKNIASAVFAVILLNFAVEISGNPVFKLAGCEDDRDDCNIINEKNPDADRLAEYCLFYKEDPAVKMCRKTCGFCGKAPSPTKLPIPGCEDDRDDCNRINEKNPDADHLAAYCLLYKDDPAVKMCRKTCGFCGKAPSPTKLPTPAPPATQQPPQPETQPPLPVITEKPSEGPRPPLPEITEKPTEGPVSGDLTGFQKECLDAHNKLRELHLNTPALKWSAELTSYAQAWANELAAQNKFSHDPKLREIGQGENLAWFSPPKRMCNGPDDSGCSHCGEFVQDWYSEIEDYSFAKGEGKTRWSVYLHFTQVVWKATSEVGMATAVGHNRVVAVARYRKPGNFGSTEAFKENVQQLHP